MNLNQIRIEVKPSTAELPPYDIEFEIMIDNVSFVQRITEYEKPFAGMIAGSYSRFGIQENELNGMIGNHFVKPYDIPVLVCTCGELGCWPLYAQLTRHNEYIQWSQFYQPRRKDIWDYSQFGPFAFDIDEYVREFKKICVPG